MKPESWNRKAQPKTCRNQMKYQSEQQGRGRQLRVYNVRRESKNVVENNRVDIVREGIHQWTASIPLKDLKISAGRLSTIPSQSYSSTVSNHAYHQTPNQNSKEINMSYMPTFDITSSEPFKSKSPYQGVSSAAIPTSGSYPESEMESNELDLRPVPQVPTNTPEQIPLYDYMNGPHLETGSWNQPSESNTNSGIVGFQNFGQSYFTPAPMQTTNSDSFHVNPSPAFHQSFGYNEISNLDNSLDIAFSPETPGCQNPDNGATGGYSGSYY
ncbi:hypothetical protein BPOR_1318g00030 [Botrytis porri]|uniref:Uncharacterized protein n=1 Tax=Botrytis porri TaxID=87229 RepID=A0A4Z1KAH5_9HELO|nr:hypothetical protein BPOR_1318g00030 [Botrytis porri]